MPERLRLFPFWLALGWGLVGAIVWLSLTGSPPRVDVPDADKVGHLAGYGLLTLWFMQLYASTRARLFHAGLFILMGIALEFLQEAGGVRHFEPADMAANALGVLAGFVVGVGPLGRLLPALEQRWLSR